MASPVISPDEYRAAIGWTREKFAAFSEDEARYFAAELRQSGISDGRILEIGFGNGNFAGWASRQGHFAYSGIEVDPELIARGRAIGLDVSTATDGWGKADTFDAIVAFDILEHIPLAELPDLFRKIRFSLRKGGRFVARFPSGDSPFARHMQYGDLTHLSAVGATMVEQLARVSGLRVLAIRAPAFPLRGLGLWRKVRHWISRAVQFFLGIAVRVAFDGNAPRMSDPQMLIVLIKPE